jgi:cytochrome c
VGAKYAGNASAAQHLSLKIKNGGSGAWGSVPMPPNPDVREADLKAIVAWVLEQK